MLIMISAFQISIEKLERNFHFFPSVCTLGYMPDWIAQRHQIPKSLQFCFRLSGKQAAEYYINGRLYSTGYPHLFIKYPDIEIVTKKQFQYEGFYFTYPAEQIYQFIAMGVPQDLYLSTLDSTDMLCETFSKVVYYVEHCGEFCAADRIDSSRFRMIEDSLLSIRSREPQNSQIEKKIRTIASHLKIHYQNEESFDSLAKECGLSRRSFFRNWKEIFGIPPRQWLQMQRFAEASRLLKETTLDIATIGEILGYQETSSFCTAFKRYWGITPLHCRHKRVIPTRTDDILS